MIEIVPAHRALLGGMVAGLIGVAVFAGAKASADPLLPAPSPAPVVPAPSATERHGRPRAGARQQIPRRPAGGKSLCAAGSRHGTRSAGIGCGHAGGADASDRDSRGLRDDP